MKIKVEYALSQLKPGVSWLKKSHKDFIMDGGVVAFNSRENAGGDGTKWRVAKIEDGKWVARVPRPYLVMLLNRIFNID